MFWIFSTILTWSFVVSFFTRFIARWRFSLTLYTLSAFCNFSSRASVLVKRKIASCETLPNSRKIEANEPFACSTSRFPFGLGYPKISVLTSCHAINARFAVFKVSQSTLSLRNCSFFRRAAIISGIRRSHSACRASRSASFASHAACFSCHALLFASSLASHSLFNFPSARFICL